MKTAFSKEQMAFTKRAHLAARTQVYAKMLNHLPITFEDTVGTEKDLEYAIDCKVAVTVPDLRAPIRISVQERWRRPSFRRYGDVTLTEWNSASGQPSEVHKLDAQLFMYGFYDERVDRIDAAVAVTSLAILHGIVTGGLEYGRQSRIDQTFLTFPVRFLESNGAILYKYSAQQ